MDGKKYRKVLPFAIVALLVGCGSPGTDPTAGQDLESQASAARMAFSTEAHQGCPPGQVTFPINSTIDVVACAWVPGYWSGTYNVVIKFFSPNGGLYSTETAEEGNVDVESWIPGWGATTVLRVAGTQVAVQHVVGLWRAEAWVDGNLVTSGTFTIQ